MKTIFAGLFATAGLLTLFTSPAQACSCLVTDESEATARADLVFSGTVTNRNVIQQHPEGIGANRVTWRFRVDEVKKGSVPVVQEVTTTDSSASCGMEFQIGARYRIYATKNTDGVWTNLCSGNQLLNTTNQSTSSQTNGSGCNQSPSARNQNTDRGISSFFNTLGMYGSR